MSPINHRQTIPTTVAGSSFDIIEFFRENTPWKVIARIVVHPEHDTATTDARIEHVKSVIG